SSGRGGGPAGGRPPASGTRPCSTAPCSMAPCLPAPCLPAPCLPAPCLPAPCLPPSCLVERLRPPERSALPRSALFHLSPQRALQRTEAPAILGWCQANLAAKQAAEEAGILIADLVRNGFDRGVLGLQHLLGF